MLSMIVAMSERDRVIGLDGDLPWKLSADLKRFKKITTAHPVIMGRKTWESIPEKFRPLPERRNIILTRNPEFAARGADVCESLEQALSTIPDDLEAFLIGGTSVFEAGLQLAERIYLTRVEYDGPGDTFFPEDPFERFEPQQDWEGVDADDKNSHASFFCVMGRREGS
jgi:dihydrofolate reductase